MRRFITVGYVIPEDIREDQSIHSIDLEEGISKGLWKDNLGKRDLLNLTVKARHVNK